MLTIYLRFMLQENRQFLFLYCNMLLIFKLHSVLTANSKQPLGEVLNVSR